MSSPPLPADLRNIVISLTRFAQHTEGCPVEQWMPEGPEDFDCPPCNCGLDKLLGEAREACPLPSFPPDVPNTESKDKP